MNKELRNRLVEYLLKEGVDPMVSLIQLLGATPAEGKRNTYKFSTGKSDIYFKKNGRDIELDLLQTPEQFRGGGNAKMALNQFLNATDEVGVDVTLSAVPRDKSTNSKRLKRFYQKFGFEFINEPEEDEFGDFTQSDFDFEMIRYAN